MNILDALVLTVFVAVFLYYCHKRQKLFFRKKENGDSPKAESPKAGNPVPPAIPAAPYPPYPYPYPYGYMHGAQATAPASQDGAEGGALGSITLCRLIPWTFSFNPLPFTDPGERAASADDAVCTDIISLGATLDGEIKSLNSEGYTVSGISVVSLPLGDGAVRALFCITCTGGTV